MTVKLKPNHLLIIHDDQGSKEFILEATRYSIGRHPNCDIRLKSYFVSRHPATLLRKDREDGSYYYQIIDHYYRIIDGKRKPSADSMMINGYRMVIHDLKNEDEVIFGPGVRAIYHSPDRSTFPSDLADEMGVMIVKPGSRPYFKAELD